MFLAIARCGSLTAAARAMGVSQPTVGRRLRVLEQGYAQPLLLRTREGFTPTEAGEILLGHARRMEDEALSLTRRLHGGDERLAGLLRISSSEWFGRHVLTPWFVAFCANHRDVVIELVADTRFLSLDRREADLLFRFRRFEEPDVVQRRFAHIEYGVYAAPSYLADHGTPGTDSDGSGHRIVSMNTTYGGVADIAWLTTRLPAARTAFRSNSRDVQAEACRRGAGIAMLPQAMTIGLDLVELKFCDPAPGRDMWVGFHPDLKSMPRLRALLDFPLPR